MTKIKFGTDGWRAIIAKEYTVDNVKRVASATAKWLKSQHLRNQQVVIGYDCRFGGKLFAQESAISFCEEGFTVLLSNDFVSTPMVSLGTARLNADLGIVITASHNPPEYNGFKVKASYGGPATPAQISQIEAMIQDEVPTNKFDFSHYLADQKIKYIDLDTLYGDAVKKQFDLEAIRNANLGIAYDGMYGAGQKAVRTLLPEATLLHCEFNPSFHGTAPEPIHKNLGELSALLKGNKNLTVGFANDGDADRIGMYDENGDFVDSHHLLLLLVDYLKNHKGFEGDVISTFSCTSKVEAICKQFGIKHHTTKIGFKYICDLMVEGGVNAMVGGEESGGIAIAGHVPERDGIWIALTILEYMAKSGKSLTQLIQDLYAKIGEFSVERSDLHLTDDLKNKVMANCAAGNYSAFGEYPIEKTEDTDGFKFHLGNSRWVMIRPSGTEPVLRTYAEAKNSTEAFAILAATEKILLG
ncbi:MAG: phosphomannomutase [Sphingobacteriales bacterium]|jgi:phosphomannomutase